MERLCSFWMLKCTSTKEKGPQSVSFIERFFSIVSFIQSPLSEVLLSNMRQV